MSLHLAILSIALLICFPAVSVRAQSQPQDEPPKIVSQKPQVQRCDGLAKKSIIANECLQPLELSHRARLARAFQYQFSLAEQFGTISGANGAFLQAPEHYLIQHSLTFQFSELFLSSADFAKILKSYYDGLIAPGKPLAPANSRAVSLAQLCPKGSPLQCIADSGGWWKRALSGVTGTFSLSERQRVVGGILIPEGSFPANYDRTGQITFDPAQLFIKGSNWSGALSVLAEMRVVEEHDGVFSNHEKKAYANAHRGNYDECLAYSGAVVKPEAASKDHPLFDSGRVSDCISTFGGSKRGGVGFLAAAVPKFTFKRASQFDFVKSSGILIPAPFGERAVNSYTFVWDLSRLIAPSSARLAVMDAMTQPSKVAKAEESDRQAKAAEEAKAKPPSSKLCVTISHGQPSYLPVSSSFTDAACRKFARNLDQTGQYRLGCVLGDDVSLGLPVNVNAPSDLPVDNSCHWSDGQLAEN